MALLVAMFAAAISPRRDSNSRVGVRKVKPALRLPNGKSPSTYLLRTNCPARW
jgi:hypothetical protein